MIKTIQFGLHRHFYFGMSLLICLVVAIGFGPRLDKKLLHPATPVPAILYWHAVVFPGWVVLFVMQSALARTGNANLHRRLGPIGAGLGAILPILGIATAFVLQKSNGMQDADVSVSINDMLTFAIAFWLAIYWRRRVEMHRRLMFIATCSLTAAAFARFPHDFAPFPWMYVYLDLLILMGMLRDLVVDRRFHQVYLYGMPAVMLGQVVAVSLAVLSPPIWLAIVRFLLH